MRYTIPKDISSEMKFTKSLYLFDIASILITMLFAWLLSPLVYNPLIAIYYIFVFISIVILVSKSINNPKKRTYQSLYYSLVRSRRVYKRE